MSENVRFHHHSKVLLNIDKKHEICIIMVKYMNIRTANSHWRSRGEPYLTYRKNTGLEDKLIRGMNEILLYLKNHVSIDKYFEVEKFFMERA